MSLVRSNFVQYTDDVMLERKEGRGITLTAIYICFNFIRRNKGGKPPLGLIVALDFPRRAAVSWGGEGGRERKKLGASPVADVHCC